MEMDSLNLDWPVLLQQDKPIEAIENCILVRQAFLTFLKVVLEAMAQARSSFAHTFKKVTGSLV